jgi:hypothetical protein
MLLRAVPIRHDRRKLPAIRSRYLDYDTGAHASDSHPKPSTGILNRTQSSDFIHSHVRHFKQQACMFLACLSSCSA